MKFYQVTVYPYQTSAINETISHVFNYATLAEALACPFYAGDEKKGVRDGEPYKDWLGKETYQYHHTYTKKHVNEKMETINEAVIELCWEHIIQVEGGQTTEMRKVVITEVQL